MNYITGRNGFRFTETQIGKMRVLSAIFNRINAVNSKRYLETEKWVDSNSDGFVIKLICGEQYKLFYKVEGIQTNVFTFFKRTYLG